jgi:hypothetical protein
METSSIIAITAAATTAITTPLTILLTKGVDAWLRLRKATTEEDHYTDTRIDQNYLAVIGQLRGELAVVREALAKLQDEHVECIRVSGELSGRLTEIEKAMSRHDRANKEQIQTNRREIEARMKEAPAELRKELEEVLATLPKEDSGVFLKPKGAP